MIGVGKFLRMMMSEDVEVPPEIEHDVEDVTPEAIMEHVNDVFMERQPDFVVVIFGIETDNGIVPLIARSDMDIENLLFLRHALDVHIRKHVDGTMMELMGETIQ